MSSTAELLRIILGVHAVTGLFMVVVGWVGDSEWIRARHVRVDRPSRIDSADHRRAVIVNGALSGGVLLVGPLLLAPWLFRDGPVSAWRCALEAGAVLAVYDFFYYLLHRFAFHEWSVGRRIHAVHHRVRAPYARDSLYIHPAETLGGVLVFLGSTWAVGPIGVWSYGLAFLVYSVLNVFIHSGIDVRAFPWRWVTALVRHHDVHHASMKGGYYASITPVWDWVFRTTGPGAGHDTP